MASDFYLRYYVGHKGKFGHEFLEFEFRPDGERGAGPGAGGCASGGPAGRAAGAGWELGNPGACVGFVTED